MRFPDLKVGRSLGVWRVEKRLWVQPQLELGLDWKIYYWHKRCVENLFSCFIVNLKLSRVTWEEVSIIEGLLRSM